MKRMYLSLWGSGKNSIDDVIKKLDAYAKELEEKTIKFKEKLIEVGIKTAYENSGEYGQFIVFESKDLESKVSFLVGKDGQKILKEWYTDKNKTNHRSYEISPLLMAEFGSGWLANVLDNVSGVGQGTMPNSYGHATNPNGWYWYDEDGVKHHSMGESPTYPMHAASIAMLLEVDRVAKEVFG